MLKARNEWPTLASRERIRNDVPRFSSRELTLRRPRPFPAASLYFPEAVLAMDDTIVPR